MFKGLFSLSLCLAIVFQGSPALPAAEAASCSKVGAQSGRLKHSGVVSSDSAKVCGKELWRLLPKPVKPVKPIVTKRPVKRVHWKNEFSVTPDRPKIGHPMDLSLQVGEEIVLNSLAISHTRNRMLLWYPTQVRFRPVSASWHLADGSEVVGEKFRQSWTTPGTYEVRLRVSYSVKYRILGKSEWFELSGEISRTSSPISITVGKAEKTAFRLVRLVHWDCFQKPSAIGC